MFFVPPASPRFIGFSLLFVCSYSPFFRNYTTRFCRHSSFPPLETRWRRASLQFLPPRSSVVSSTSNLSAPFGRGRVVALHFSAVDCRHLLSRKVPPPRYISGPRLDIRRLSPSFVVYYFIINDYEYNSQAHTEPFSSVAAQSKQTHLIGQLVILSFCLQNNLTRNNGYCRLRCE